MRTLTLLGLGLAVTGLACGGRSSLGALEGSGTGGTATAGTTSTTSAGAGGTGGQGGGGPCSAEALPPRSFDLPSDAIGRAPQLVASSLDGSRVSLLTVAAPEPIPLDANPFLQQVTLDDAWTAWTDQPLGTARLVGPALSFEAPHQPGDGLTVWVNSATQATGQQAYYVQEADPLVESPPSTVLLGFTPPHHHVTVPVLGSSSVGYEQVSETVLALAAPGALVPFFTDYCPLPPPLNGSSDAVAVTNGFLVAAVGPQFVGCDAPLTLNILRHDVGELPVEVGALLPGGLLSHTWLLPRPGGAWVLAVQPMSASVTLWAQALDEQGQSVDTPFLVDLPPLFEPATLTVASFGDGFAYAVLTADSGEVGAIEVQTFDGAGVPGLGWSLTPTAAPRSDEPLSLLPGPDADALLLAWSSTTTAPGVAGNARVFATRLGCF